MSATTEAKRLAIWAIATTRNEADIIAANVRHHLSQGIDHFLIVDNGSTDGTIGVLSRLAWDVSLEWSSRPGCFRQKDLLTELAREAFIRGADWVLPVDADEFWYAPGTSIRRVLEETSAGALEVQIVNFVQRREQRVNTPDGLLSMTRRPPVAIGPIERIAELVESNQIAFVEHLYPAKWVARTSPTLEIGWGNHYLFGAREPLQPTNRIICLHAPLRSRAVLEQKVDALRPTVDLDDYLREAWHIRRWRRIAAQRLLDREWDANSYLDDTLDVYGKRRPLVEDTRLRDLVSPSLTTDPEAADVQQRHASVAGLRPSRPAMDTRNADTGIDASSSVEAQRRMEIIEGLTRELDRLRADVAKWRREVDVHGRMLAASSEAETQLARLKVQFAKMQAQLAKTQAQLETSHARLQQSEHMVTALRRSLSWRITAPVRAVWDLVLWARWKWSAAPADNGSPPVAPAAVATRLQTAAATTTTSRFLVIAESVPTPDLDSGSYRLYLLLKLLSEQGHVTTLLCHQEEAQRRYVEDVRRLGLAIHCGADAVIDFLRREGHGFQYVMLSRPETAFRYLFPVRAMAVHATVVYDTVDLHWVRMQRQSALLGDAEIAHDAERYGRIERFNSASSDMVIAITETEKSMLLEVDPRLRVELIPNIHPTVERAGRWESRRDLFFIGGFWHRPNEDAMQFFVADVLPLVQRTLPDVVLTIVGSNMPDSVKVLGSATVHSVGYVEDPVPYFARSRVFVSPLRYGAGMKGKIGQSMSHGLPVVTTSVGAEGMMLVDGETALIADSPEAFAHAVIRLYTDEPLWMHVSDASTAHIREHFSPDAARRRLLSIFPIRPSSAAAVNQ
jgi:glycosyltransferase involved in cell wall biosynthesis